MAWNKIKMAEIKDKIRNKIYFEKAIKQWHKVELKGMWWCDTGLVRQKLCHSYCSVNCCEHGRIRKTSTNHINFNKDSSWLTLKLRYSQWAQSESHYDRDRSVVQTCFWWVKGYLGPTLTTWANTGCIHAFWCIYIGINDSAYSHNLNICSPDPARIWPF